MSWGLYVADSFIADRQIALPVGVARIAFSQRLADLPWPMCASMPPSGAFRRTGWESLASWREEHWRPRRPCAIHPRAAPPLPRLFTPQLPGFETFRYP